MNLCDWFFLLKLHNLLCNTQDSLNSATKLRSWNCLLVNSSSVKPIPLHGNILLPSNRIYFSLKCYLTSIRVMRQKGSTNRWIQIINIQTSVKNSWFKILYFVLDDFITGICSKIKLKKTKNKMFWLINMRADPRYPEHI